MNYDHRHRKLESPSAERNKDPIWDRALQPHVLPPILEGLRRRGDAAGGRTDDGHDDKPQRLNVLEVAAGAGVHMQHFALKLLQLLEEQQHPCRLQWYPTDASPSCLESQLAYRDELGDALQSVIHGPLLLTLHEHGIVESETYQLLSQAGNFQLIVCINMIHIAPWTATLGLFRMASQLLDQDTSSNAAALVLYGPFRVNNTMVDSNVRFDGWLKSQDPAYGVRNLEDVVDAAQRLANLCLDETIEMPANNLCLVFRRRRRRPS